MLPKTLPLNGVNIVHHALQEVKEVLFLCFNWTLANVISNHLDPGSSITVNTFHGYSGQRIGEVEPEWFNNNRQLKMVVLGYLDINKQITNFMYSGDSHIGGKSTTSVVWDRDIQIKKKNLVRNFETKQ